MPVHVDVIKEVLVDRIVDEVMSRYPGDPAPRVAQALAADVELPVCDGGALDMRLRRVGYLTRLVEADMFEPARSPMDGLAGLLARRLTVSTEWGAAVAALGTELAREEPLPRPDPGDDQAIGWRVPGPGGHVRHYVVAAAIADALEDDSLAGAELPPGVEEAGELKRSWTYGFVVRCCEEVMPPLPA